MSYTITNTDELTITITDGWRTVVIPKFRLDFEVEEPYLTIYWNLSEQGSGLGRPFITLDYTTVSSPVSTSAADLQTQIQAMQVSAFVPGGGEDLDATLALGDDAGGQEISNLSLIRDNLGRVAVDIFNRTLKDSAGNIRVDWETPKLYIYPSVSTKTADYTLVLADALTVIEGNTATSLKITVPLYSSVAFPVGTIIEFQSRSTGKVYLEATVGVTIRSRNSYLGILPSGGVARLRNDATNTWYFDGDITDAYDADAAAFFAAEEALGATYTVPQKAAMNQYFLDIKAGGVWTKSHIIYLFVGGTAVSSKLNAKNPVDSDAAFRNVPVGSPTFNSNGVVFNGTTQYLRTYYTPSVNASQNNKAIYGYWKVVGTNGAQFGAITAGFLGDEMLIVNYGATTGWALSKTDDTFVRGGTYTGRYLLNRTASNAADIRRNDVSLDTDTAATTANPAVELYIGCRNRAGVGAEIFCADTLTHFWVGESLTSGEATALYNAEVTMNTALGR